MKRYGQKPKLHNYPDNHPQKGRVNWWEQELDSYNKKTARQYLKKDTIQEVTLLREERDYGKL